MLLCLTGEKIEWGKERGGGKNEESGGGGVEKDEEEVDIRTACLCTVVCMSVCGSVSLLWKKKDMQGHSDECSKIITIIIVMMSAEKAGPPIIKTQRSSLSLLLMFGSRHYGY